MKTYDTSIPVDMIDAETKKVIKTFPSMKKASIEMGITASCISYACCGMSKLAGGYIWRKNFEYGKKDEKSNI